MKKILQQHQQLQNQHYLKVMIWMVPAMEEAQKATMELNKSYQIPAFNVQTNTTEADRNTTVDISNPISEQLKEINEYAAQVIT